MNRFDGRRKPFGRRGFSRRDQVYVAVVDVVPRAAFATVHKVLEPMRRNVRCERVVLAAHRATEAGITG